MAEGTGDDPSDSLKQTTQISNLDAIPQPAIDTTQGAEAADPTYQPLLGYIEARQQVLLYNITCCNHMLELLEQILTNMSELHSTTFEEQHEKGVQPAIQETEDPGEDCQSASDVLQTQLACDLEKKQQNLSN